MKSLLLSLFFVSSSFLFSQISFDEANICNNGIAGISIVNLNTGKNIFQKNSQKYLCPASSLKLLSTFSAYDMLGKDFTFKTKILHEGRLDRDGTLNGNIVVVSGGDPTLGSKRLYGENADEEVFNSILNFLKKQGISCVDGNLILDISLFDDYPIAINWPANDLGNYYAAGAWPLNFMENEYDLYFNTKGKIGETPKIVGTSLRIGGLNFDNRLKIGNKNSGDQAYIYNGPYVYHKTILGTLPQGYEKYKIRGAIPDPAKYFISQLYKHLVDNGISINKYQISKQSKNKKNAKYHIVESKKLSDLITLTNEESINLYADAMYFYLKSQNNFINSPADLIDYFKIKSDGILLYDGCGLSPQNAISASVFTELLKAFFEKNGFESTSELLAEGGKSGTVKSMFTNSGIVGNVFLKSGSMEGVLSYTGIVYSKKKVPYAFSFIFNKCESSKLELRKTVEDIIQQLFNSL